MSARHFGSLSFHDHPAAYPVPAVTAQYPHACRHYPGPQAAPCFRCLVERADRLAERAPALQAMLREVDGSTYGTRVFLGSSRAPSYAELLAAVERVERGPAL